MATNTPIAIVGMSCRFAGDVDSPEKLWNLVAEGRSAWSEIPKDRFNIDGFYHPNFEKLNGVSFVCLELLEADSSADRGDADECCRRPLPQRGYWPV